MSMSRLRGIPARPVKFRNGTYQFWIFWNPATKQANIIRAPLGRSPRLRIFRLRRELPMAVRRVRGIFWRHPLYSSHKLAHRYKFAKALRLKTHPKLVDRPLSNRTVRRRL